MARSILSRRRNERLALIPAREFVGPTPTILSVSPAFGDYNGGTTVTITGTNFVDGAKAYLGRVGLLDLVYVDSTTLTGKTPAMRPGLEMLTVVNPAGQYAQLPSAFEFVAFPSAELLTESGANLYAEVSGLATEALVLE